MQNLFDETVILRKKYDRKEGIKNKLRNGEFTIEKKKKNNNNYKLDEDTGDYNSPVIDRKISNLIKTGRLNKNLNQKTLAQKLNIQSNLLNEYESGKKKPDNIILGKLERILKIKLRGDKSKLGTKI